MVFRAPAVHYSALATLPPELKLSKSQHSIKHTASIRFKLSRIFKRLLTQEIHNQHTITTEIEEHIQLPKLTLRLPETKEKENNNNTANVLNNRECNISTNHELTKSTPSLIESLERLPFSEPYFATTSKNEKFPRFELSTYHKHCIHQQKFIDQKQYPQVFSTKQTSNSQLNPPSTINEHHTDLTNSRLQHLIDPSHQSKSNSTTTLPISSSIENRIGLQYASRKSTTMNSHRFSHTQQQSQHLRRLHSKLKIRSISTDTKKSFSPSTISSSIAHRIELLKQAMHNNHLEFHQCKSEKTSPVDSPSHSSIYPINKQTQTNDKSSEMHHIHHHHIYSSSLEWRTYLYLLGTLCILFLLLIELTTMIF